MDLISVIREFLFLKLKLHPNSALFLTDFFELVILLLGQHRLLPEQAKCLACFCATAGTILHWGIFNWSVSCARASLEEKPGGVQLITHSSPRAPLNLGVSLFTNMHDFIEFRSNCHNLKMSGKELGNSLVWGQLRCFSWESPVTRHINPWWLRYSDLKNVSWEEKLNSMTYSYCSPAQWSNWEPSHASFINSSAKVFFTSSNVFPLQRKPTVSVSGQHFKRSVCN